MTEAAQTKRPRWLKAYTVYLILSVIVWLLILGQLSGIAHLFTSNSRIAFDISASIVLAAAAAVAVVGLLLMKRWGWIAAIVNNVLCIGWSVFNLTYGGIGRDWVLLAFFAFMLFWLIRHRTLFE